MPYKYIGRTTSYKGKTLWEILANLKNFGVGRVVIRGIFDRYPEPSYCKILKVEPLQCPEGQNLDNLRKVRVYVEKTFRGVTCPTPMKIEKASYKSDYRLIPKDEEESYCKKITQEEKLPILPRTMDFPPILEEVILREKKARGEDIQDKLKLEIVYRSHTSGKFRIAEDDETPTVKISVNSSELPNVSVYKNVKIST